MVSNDLGYAKLSAKDRDAGEPRVVLIDNIEVLFRWCPADTFTMGSPKGEKGRDNRDNIATQHQVTLTKGFWIMETPVTVGMFMKFLTQNSNFNSNEKKKYFVWKEGHGGRFIEFSWNAPPSDIIRNSLWPVTCVKWDAAKAFCQWLSDEKGLKMRLPTEAEWEYACRAGKIKKFDVKLLDEMAWFPYKEKKREIHPVAEKKPNAWGIYDMLGNVWEWCYDWYEDYSSKSVTDPIGTKDKNWRVLRGGSWASEVKHCRPASRLVRREWYSTNYYSFRVVCECEQQ